MYCISVNNMVIEKLFIEEPKIEDSKHDPFRVSDSTTMLHYLHNNIKYRIYLDNNILTLSSSNYEILYNLI